MKITQKPLYDLPKLISLRQLLHSSPELSFQEHETQSKIKSFLHTLGLPDSSIIPCAKTGLIVNICGKAPPQGSPFILALRADIDALEMPEHNPDLLYRSSCKAAHMCGHDGHTVCLLGNLLNFFQFS